MHRLKSRGVCSHTIFTHTSAQSVVIKKRWHLGWIVWEKTVINESAASPHSCTSLSSWFFFLPLSHPSLCTLSFAPHMLSFFFKISLCIFLFTCQPQLLTPSVISSPSVHITVCSSASPSSFLISTQTSITFIFTHLHRFPPSSFSDSVTT